MPSMPWVKIYVEMLDDVKLSRLTAEQCWRFVQLILLAGECDAAGALVTGDTSMTRRDIAWRLRCDEKILSQDTEIMVRLGLILWEEDTLIIQKFSDRQGPTQDEKRKQWRDRQQKRRNRAKNATVTSDSLVTHGNVTPLEEEEEEEVEVRQLSPLQEAFISTSGISDYSTDGSECLRAMYDAGCRAEHVTEAVNILQRKKYTIKGIRSIETTAVNLAKQSKNENKEEEEHFWTLDNYYEEPG